MQVLITPSIYDRNFILISLSYAQDNFNQSYKDKREKQKLREQVTNINVHAHTYFMTYYCTLFNVSYTSNEEHRVRAIIIKYVKSINSAVL